MSLSRAHTRARVLSLYFSLSGRSLALAVSLIRWFSLSLFLSFARSLLRALSLARTLSRSRSLSLSLVSLSLSFFRCLLLWHLTRRMSVCCSVLQCVAAYSIWHGARARAGPLFLSRPRFCALSLPNPRITLSHAHAHILSFSLSLPHCLQRAHFASLCLSRALSLSHTHNSLALFLFMIYTYCWILTDVLFVFLCLQNRREHPHEAICQHVICQHVIYSIDNMRTYVCVYTCACTLKFQKKTWTMASARHQHTLFMICIHIHLRIVYAFGV